MIIHIIIVTRQHGWVAMAGGGFAGFHAERVSGGVGHEVRCGGGEEKVRVLRLIPCWCPLPIFERISTPIWHHLCSPRPSNAFRARIYSYVGEIHPFSDTDTMPPGPPRAPPPQG